MNNSHKNPVVGIIMGSESDMPAMEACMKQLDEFGIPYEVKVASAHRKPAEVHVWASTAAERGIKVIIAAAGKAAHLGGVVAAYTPLPVIAVPMKTSDLGGLDSLLSMVQMPSGVPVACVAINGAKNAAILAVQMIGTGDEAARAKNCCIQRIYGKRIIANTQREDTVAKSFLMGNEAFAHAALEAGVRVCAGYPGTPSSEVIETIAKAHENGSAEGVYC